MILIETGLSVSDGSLSRGRFIAVGDDGVIEAVGGPETAEAYKGARRVDLRGYTVLPGLIDSHVHGGAGFDTMDGTYEAINAMSKHKIKEGVTSFMPTTVTASDAMTDAAISGVAEAARRGVDGAKVAGLFLEGPYINAKNKGAHPAEFIKPVNLPEMLSLVERAQAAVPGMPVSLAMAAELPGATEAIKAVTAKGVRLRMGHSAATWAEATAGADAGAAAVIHTYNAMSPLNHREPGLTGAALTDGRLYAEIIVDLVHVHAKAVQVVAGMKGAERTVLITDCMRAGGLPDGDYTLGELPVVVKNGEARLHDGALAGSTANLLGCLKNMVQAVGVPLADAVSMATATPARALGIFDAVGSLAAGKRADIIAVDEDFRLVFVMVDGTEKLNGSALQERK